MKHIAPTEAEFDKALLNGNFSVVLPKRPSHDDIFNTLEVCCKKLGWIGQKQVELIVAVGRLLVMVKERPEIFTSRGYKTFEDFLKRYIEPRGISRTYSFLGRKIAESFPNLPSEQYGKIPVTSWQVLVQSTDQFSTNHTRLLERAEKMPPRAFRDWATKQGMIANGETEGTFLTVGMNKEQKSEIEEFFDSKEAQEKMETSNRAEMLIALIQEYRGGNGI